MNDPHLQMLLYHHLNGVVLATLGMGMRPQEITGVLNAFIGKLEAEFNDDLFVASDEISVSVAAMVEAAKQAVLN
jgi:hypothetical protein